MYITITGSKNNKDVYIAQSFRKENGKTSSRIHKKLGKLNDLLEQFYGDEEKMMAWAKEEAVKETALFNQNQEKVSIYFSQTARIPLDEERAFNVGYLFLQRLCSELRIDNICRNIRNRHKFINHFLQRALQTMFLQSARTQLFKRTTNVLDPFRDDIPNFLKLSFYKFRFFFDHDQTSVQTRRDARQSMT